MVDDEFDGTRYISPNPHVIGHTLHMHKSNLMVFAAYCRHGCCQHVLDRVAELTFNGAAAFLLMADFNVVPQDLLTSPMLAALDAEIVEPTGGSFTCHQGGGRMFDYPHCLPEVPTLHQGVRDHQGGPVDTP